VDDFDLIDWVIEDANSVGEDFNDGDIRPGWLTSEWLSEETLEVTYTNPEAPEPVVRQYRITRIEE